MGKKSKRVKSKTKASSPFDPATNNSNKYVVARCDFGRLARWPNDGIEQVSHKDHEMHVHHEVDYGMDDPLNIAMKELLGFCPSPQPLSTLEAEARGFIVSLPYIMQTETAEKQSDESSAKQHLIEAYKRKDPAVMLLLEEINCKKAIYKATTEISRFPDLLYIIVPLFQKNLASDKNIELLFGKVSNVRHLLFEIGSQFAEPPPINSPAFVHLSQFFYKGEGKDEKVASVPKICAECGTSSERNQKCIACKTVSYCSTDCQKSHWRIHKPDCLKAQGKNVPESVLRKAQNAQKKKDENKAELDMQRQEDLNAEFCVQFEEFLHESPRLCDTWAHDCYGKRLLMHVPTVNANNMIEICAMTNMQLQKVQTLSLGMYPNGIDDKKYGFRGIDLRNPENNARILVLFERLFENHGEGLGCGLHIDGIFVIDKVVNKKAKWKLVTEPFALYTPQNNRNERLLKYLQVAKDEAKSVPDSVDLGIHNPGDPDLTVLPTEFGDYLKIN